MGNYNLGTLAISVVIALALAVIIAKVALALLRDEHRKIVGGTFALIGVIAAIFGVVSVNSIQSQMGRVVGQPDLAGRVTLALGVLIAIVGLVILFLKKKTQVNLTQAQATKKCPDCAETIQADAKVCRFCGKKLEGAAITS